MAYICQEVVEIPFMCSNASQRLVHMSFFSDSQITRPALKINISQATIIVGPNAISTASTWQSSGTSVGPGIYHLVLTQSECSSQGVPGYVMLYTSTATTGPNYIRLYFPRIDSYDTTRMGLVALPNAAAEAAGGLVTSGTGAGQLSVSGGSVGLKAQTHSDVTIKGLQNYANFDSVVTLAPGTHSNVTIKGIQNYANISSVTLNAGTHSGATIQGISNWANISSVTLNAGTHSGATIQGISNYANISVVTLAPGTHSDVTIKGIQNYANISSVTLNAGTHSGATIQGLNRINSNVTLNADTHSGATIQGVTRVNSSVTPANAVYSGVTVRIDLVDYSGATLGINNIAAGSYSGVSIQGVTRLNSNVTLNAALHSGATVQGVENYANFPTTVELTASSITAMAFAVVNRSIDNAGFGGRTVGSALAGIRNRVVLTATDITVYDTDDTTVVWTGPITTGASPIASVDPT